MKYSHVINLHVCENNDLRFLLKKKNLNIMDSQSKIKGRRIRPEVNKIESKHTIEQNRGVFFQKC